MGNHRWQSRTQPANPLTEQIDELLTMPGEEIIQKPGPDYAVEPAGPEGALDGYSYEDLGMPFAFYPGSDTPDLVDCYPNFKICGMGIGSRFSEIMGPWVIRKSSKRGWSSQRTQFLSVRHLPQPPLTGVESARQMEKPLPLAAF